jgi:arylsulfatase
MAVYAAMIDRMDQSIGRVLDALKRLGEYDNTLILFLSDNGGCAELMAEDGWARFFPDTTHDGRKMTMGNRTDVEPGGPLSYMSYDLPWANVSNTPYRKFKHWVHEGGISTPLIAHWPSRLKTSSVQHVPCHVVDLLPTILDAAGAEYPSELGGHAIQPTDGESFLPLLDGKEWEREQPIFFEHEGNSAIRQDNFKLVREFGRPWELYDMEQDRTELQDIIGRNGPLAQRLVREYEAWAESAGVVDWSILLPRLQAIWQTDNIHG